jgi:hypothetical protein
MEISRSSFKDQVSLRAWEEESTHAVLAEEGEENENAVKIYKRVC